MLGMVTVVVIISAAAAAALELPQLVKKGWIKEAAVYSAMLVAGSFLSIVAIKNNGVPSPLQVIITIYKPVNEWLGNLFHTGG